LKIASTASVAVSEAFCVFFLCKVHYSVKLYSVAVNSWNIQTQRTSCVYWKRKIQDGSSH